MHLKVITTIMTSSTGVTRTPTIPLTKRDSLALNGSRVSLISNQSANQNIGNSVTHMNNKSNGMACRSVSRDESKEFNKESDFVNTHPGMVAGKKRSPKKVKRTDSYKLALNRQSAFDDLDKEWTREKTHVKHKRDSENRVKYNTLPIKMGAIETHSKPEVKRKKHKDGAHKDTEQFQRSASQKSGTFPSPDTDEDQSSTKPERKKKSTFKRMKERLIQTFRKDRNKETKSRSRHTGKPVRHRPMTGGRIRPNVHGGQKGFQTPDSMNDVIMEEREEPMEVEEDSPSKGRKILHSIRSSFRKKNRPEKYSFEVAKSPQNTSQVLSHSEPIDIPRSRSQSGASNIDADEAATETNDTISEIFGSLIDPSSACFTPPNCPRPDRSKLKLEGLKKFRPRSFERKDTATAGHRSGAHAQRSSRGFRDTARNGGLSPTVEIDGLDYADAPIRTGSHFQEESDDSNQPFDAVSQEEQQRRMDDVGRRLAAMGDRIVADKESESATSSSEAGGRRLSVFEQEILDDLRRFADTKNSEFKNEGGVGIYLVPVIKKLVTAHNYRDFKQIVQRELGNTMGWEQVAWYTYLMKTTMCVVGTGKDLGTMVKNHATRYFNSNLRPFIQSRPNGWESIHEETDIEDSELD